MIEDWRMLRLLMALTLHEAGWSIDKVASHLGCAATTINRIATCGYTDAPAGSAQVPEPALTLS